MKVEQIKKFGDMVQSFCDTMKNFSEKFNKEFSEVTGDAAPEVTEDETIGVTEEVPTPAPIDEVPPTEETPPVEFGDDEVAEVDEEEVNKDIDSIKEAVDDVAESDVEESAETLKKEFSKLLKARDSLFKSPTRKNFSEVKQCCNDLFSAAEGCKTYSARRRAKGLFDCIKFFADTVEEVLNETEEVPASPMVVSNPSVEETSVVETAENPAVCPDCGKEPCECSEETFESPELDETLEMFTDRIPEDDSEFAGFCGTLANFACVAKSKEDADRKIRILKAFSKVMDAPKAETDAAIQDEVNPAVAEELEKTEQAEAKVTNVKLVEFSKLLRSTAGLSKEVIKSFSDLMADFAEKEEKKDEETEETTTEETTEEETPPPAEETEKEEVETETKEEKPSEEAPAKEDEQTEEETVTEEEETPAPTEEEETEDDSEDDEEVVIDKTEVANFSQTSSSDSYGDYLKRMLLR